MIDWALCNAFIAFNIMTRAKMKILHYRKMLAQSLIILGRPPKAGQLSSSAPTASSYKKKSFTYSVVYSFGKANLGVLWPNYDNITVVVGRAQRTSRGLTNTSNSVHAMYSFVWMKRKIASQSIMTCKWLLASTFIVPIMTHFVSIYKGK